MIAPQLSRLNEDFVLQQDSATPVTQQQAANAIRALSMDAVQKANSGHPGAPMGMADIAEVLWTKYLKHNPEKSKLGRPGPLCALQWSRLYADLFAVAFNGLRSVHRRHQGFSTASQ
jgi:hypothetical protein